MPTSINWTLHRASSFDINDEYPNKIPNGAVIHLHGSVRKITSENISESIVLGERSYVEQVLHESRWYEQFLRDVAFADHVFFIGYSLSDYFISSLLSKNPTVAKKVTLIYRNEPNAIELNRLKPYGTIEAISSDGFATWLSNVERRISSLEVTSLKAFRAMTPIRDRKSLQVATAPEIHDLLVYGNFDPGRLASSLPGETYVTSRGTEISAALDAIVQSRTLFIDSRIGNGKTIFLHLLASELSQRGSLSFLFRSGHPNINEEISALSAVDNVVIFFERYGDAEDYLLDLSTSLPKAKFVVEIRTALFELRYHDIKRITAGSFRRIGLNKLPERDERNIVSLATKAGIPVKPKSHESFSELRYILISVFNNSQVRERITKELEPLFNSVTTKRILACASLLGRNYTNFGIEIFRAIYRVDPFAELRDKNGLSSEIFEFDTDGFRVRSALLSDFLLKEYVGADEIADAASRLVRYSADRKGLRRYRALFGELMAFGNLYAAFGGNAEAVRSVGSLYEDLRHDQRVNEEPLFWLQFAIFAVEIENLDLAASYIETAYSRAQLLDKFQTYQIDTQAFRIYLLRGKSTTDKKFNETGRLLELFEIAENMLRDDSHRFHAVKVFDNVGGFFESQQSWLEESEKVAFVFRLNSVVATLRALPVDFKVRTGAEVISQQLENCIRRLI